MGIRKLLSLAAALAMVMTGLFVGTAHAATTAVPVDADVGGGATGLDSYVAHVNQYGEVTNETESASPSVTLDTNGGNTTKGLVNLNQAGVSVGVVRVHTDGKRTGDPFASSYAELARVSIPGVDIAAIRTSCNWDIHGVTATTQIVTLAGITYTPAPGTTLNIPLLGKLVLNEQGTDEVFDAAGNSQLTRWVIGVQLIKDVVHRDGSEDYRETAFGFSSCDPLVLPNLGSLLKLGGGSDG
jgi:hypothetical protein